MPVTKRTRYEVLKRDNFTCRYCRSTEESLKVDHVIPVALGGSDSPDNLVAACHDCNAGKSSTSPTGEMVEDVKAVDLAWAGAIQRAAKIKATERRKKNAYIHAWGESWESFGRTIPDDAWHGLERLYEAGLPKVEMLDAALAAATNRGVYDRFNYFMGICWKKVTALQETAKQLLAVEEAE